MTRLIAVFPVKWAAMQVHHGFDVKRIGLHAIDDGVGKTMEVELAIVAPDSAPAFRFVQDAAQRGLIFPKKIAAQTRLALVIPEGGGFELLRVNWQPSDADR